ncbi:DUF1772 domain-containing protein [Microbispora sp. RL4-1S]|uniref:DUF1772 domain-containing protein n=1 Tax=Microbispora oryzae TaxID=2806554 RepID=A0A941AHF1_9ACTN|nr:DUF1772 domain-containing protein [Microbispora oryzae]MBP2704021.1 DUF1772 domain-containing protein [Microbispora oryzae]
MPGFLPAAALLVATLTSGLIAGLFYAYTCSVMPGLRRAGDRSFVDAMQRINVAILNGWFALTFAGGPLATAAAAALHLGYGQGDGGGDVGGLDGLHRGRHDGGGVLPWTVAALLCHCAMLVITFAVNVPLNNRLDAAGPPERVADPALVRARFEARWVRWNLVRTLASVAAFACLLAGMTAQAG